MRNTRHVKKTRKVQFCDECGKEIPIGSSCRQETRLFGKGSVDFWYVCNECAQNKDWVLTESDLKEINDIEMMDMMDIMEDDEDE